MDQLMSTFLLYMSLGLFPLGLFQVTSADVRSVAPGENITLPCSLTADFISWYRQRSEELKLLISAEQTKLKKQFILVQNVNKSHFAVTEVSGSVSLVIIGVGETDLGLYYCGGRNKTAQLQFEKAIRLSFIDYQKLKPELSAGPNYLWILIIILSCVCLVSILIHIICARVFCCEVQEKKNSSQRFCRNSTDLQENDLTYINVHRIRVSRAAAH